VSLSGWMEVAVGTKMKPKGTAPEPDSAALRQVGWFGLLDESQNAPNRTRAQATPDRVASPVAHDRVQ
jgi:hypothetical protein